MQVQDHITPSTAVLADPILDSGPTPVATVRAPRRRRRVVLRMAFGLGAGAILVLTFLQLVNFRAVSHRLEHLNVFLAVLCGAIFLSAYVVRALRWRWFLLPDRVPRRRVISIYFVAVFLNWALPVQGGELAKSFMLRHSDGIPVNRSLATVGMDKAMDLLPGVVLIAVVPFAHWHVNQLLWVLLSLASLVVVVGAAVLVLASWRRDRTLAWLSWFLGLILPRRIWERVDPFIAGFVDTLLALIRRPRVLLIAAAYTAVAVSLEALFCFLAFRAVGASVSLPIALFGYTLFNLMYILPTPPGHVGSNEVIGLLVFAGIFGVTRSAVGAMFLFVHPMTALLMTVAGLFCLRRTGLSFRSTVAKLNEESIGEQ